MWAWFAVIIFFSFSPLLERNTHSGNECWKIRMQSIRLMKYKKQTNKNRENRSLFITVPMLQRKTSLVYQHRLCTQPQITWQEHRWAIWSTLRSLISWNHYSFSGKYTSITHRRMSWVHSKWWWYLYFYGICSFPNTSIGVSLFSFFQ